MHSIFKIGFAMGLLCSALSSGAWAADGINSATDSDLPIGAGGVEAMRILHGDQYVGVGTTAPIERLDVHGAVKIGSTASGCSSANAGSIRWTGAQFQGCNGSAWVSFGQPTIVGGSPCTVWGGDGNTGCTSPCPAGTTVVSGGCWISDPWGNDLTATYMDGNGWHCNMQHGGGGEIWKPMTVIAYCIR